jgi:hypothetical protein
VENPALSLAVKRSSVRFRYAPHRLSEGYSAVADVTLSFLPVFCQPADQISDFAYAVHYVKNDLPVHIKYITNVLVIQLIR